MTDAFVGLALDSTGKKIDASELAVGANTVERQRIVIADDATAASLTSVTAKGTQGTSGLAAQSFRDAGRNQITFHCDEIAGVTAEALATMTVWKGGVSSSTTSYAVTAGKTLRLTAFNISVRSTTGVVQWAKARIRSDSSTLVTTSAVIANLAAGTGTTVSGTAAFSTEVLTDGYEVAAATNVGVSHVESATTALVTICVTGFEY